MLSRHKKLESIRYVRCRYLSCLSVEIVAKLKQEDMKNKSKIEECQKSLLSSLV